MNDEKNQQASFAFILWAAWHLLSFWAFTDGMLLAWAAVLMCIAGLLSESGTRLPALIAIVSWPLTIWFNVYSLSHVKWYIFDQTEKILLGGVMLVGAYLALRTLKTVFAAQGRVGKSATT